MALTATLLVIGLTGMIAAEVISRDGLNHPLRGTAELAGMGIVVLVFLGLPAAAREGRLIRSDLLLRLLQVRVPAAAHALDRMFDATGAGFFAALALAVWPKLERALERGEFIGNAGDFTFPLWPKMAAIVLGGGLAAVTLALRALRGGGHGA